MINTVPKNAWNKVGRSSSFQLLKCPRGLLPFFHRRNSCDCLKEQYYQLKDTMKRTTPWFKCFKSWDIRNVVICPKCKSVQYCSSKCKEGNLIHLKYCDELWFLSSPESLYKPEHCSCCNLTPWFLQHIPKRAKLWNCYLIHCLL